MLPPPSSDILLFSSSSNPTPALHPASSANNKRLDPAWHIAMSRSDEQLAVSRRSAAIYGSDQHIGEFPQSISIGDFKAGCRTRLPYGSDLCRALSSVPDLRNLAFSQDSDSRSEAGSQIPPPSIMFHQRRYITSNVHDEHVFNERIYNKTRLRRKLCYKSYQDLHILSMYQEDNARLRSPTPTQQKYPSIASYSDSDSSDASSPAPKTPVDLRPPKEFENEKARRTQARQVQVIEQRHEYEEGEDEGEGEGEEDVIQLQATVLDRGKARLVLIQRPPNSDQSSKQNRHHDSDSPRTPVRDQHEMSSFSPYDTPAYGTPFSDISRTASEGTPVPRKQPRLSIITQLATLHSRPRTPTQRLSAGSTDTAFSADERQRSKHLANPFGSPLFYNSSSFTRSSSPEWTHFSTSDARSVSEGSQRSNIYSQDMYEQRLDRAISLTAKAIEAHANLTFSLDSPVLSLFLTNVPGNGLDGCLIPNLNKIFMHSSHPLLSALAAWLIVDQHYTRLFDAAPPKMPLAMDNYTLPVLDSSCAVAPFRTAMLAQAPWPTTKTYSYHPEDTEKMNNNISISSPLCTTKIPSKAASLLGINTDPAGCKPRLFTSAIPPSSRSNSVTIEGQARSVHASVQEVGRNLVKQLAVAPTVSSPDSITRQRGLRMMHMRGRSMVTTHQSNNASASDDAIDSAVNSLWEACRCVASTL